jgi:hypothetical protein
MRESATVAKPLMDVREVLEASVDTTSLPMGRQKR